MSASAVDTTCEIIEKTLGRSPAFRKVEERLYVVKQGSAYVTVSVLPSKKKPERPLVRVYAQVVSGARPEASLFRKLLVLNARMRFGAFAFVPEGGLVLFVHSILGGATIDPHELVATVGDIALTADAFDDQIVAEYGGRRMQDIVEEQALVRVLGEEGDALRWDEGGKAS